MIHDNESTDNKFTLKILERQGKEKTLMYAFFLMEISDEDLL